MRIRAVLACAAALTSWTSTTLADRVVTVDNRVLSPKKAREKDGGYVLEFEHGTIVLKDKSLVKAVEIEGDMSEYVPQNDDEKKKLEQGYVKYRGKWFSKPAYADELRREAEAGKKRADDLAAHAQFTNAWQKVTKHFTVNSNTSPELLNYYCDLLETYYALMDDRFGINPSPDLRRLSMEVNVFKSRREFHKLNKAGLGGGVAGYFDPVDHNLNFYHDYQEPSISEWVSLHECTHLLTHLIDPQYVSQIWLNEAVADYFGSSDVTRDKKGKLSIRPGKLQTDRVLTVQQAIKDAKDIKLEKLFELDRSEFYAFEYAHAWSFIYFLNEANSKYKKGFDRFFKDIYTLAKGVQFETVAHYDKSGTGKQVPPQEIRRIVLKTLGATDVEALDKEWKGFIAAIPIEGAEARFKRGLRVVQGQVEIDSAEKFQALRKQALDDLTAAIDGGIKDPRAWWARSQLLDGMGKDEDAKKDIAVALEMDPLNATYHWAQGDLMYDGFSGFDIEGWSITITRSEKQEPPSEEAKQHFGLAMDLAPDNDSYRENFARMCGP